LASETVGNFKGIPNWNNLIPANVELIDLLEKPITIILMVYSDRMVARVMPNIQWI
jgi:hypothetical protein